MVLESLINPTAAERDPKKLFLLGFLYSSIGIMASLWIFRSEASMVMVFLTVIASVPLMYNTIKEEEDKDKSIFSEIKLLGEHAKALEFFMFMFVGFTLAYAFWYTLLPIELVRDSFSTQMQTIITINSSVTGNAMQRLATFGKIFFNNLRVLIFCVLFSFIFGVGAIFILTWNASVIGAAIGNFIRTNISKYAESLHFARIGGYFHVISHGLFQYAIHGIPEIGAYFVGGLAGGIISIAVIRHDFDGEKFGHIVMDSSDLLFISIGLLIVAAFLEVYVTPLLF